MRHRYIVLLMAVLFVAALAFAAAPGAGQKTVAPATSGQSPGTAGQGVPAGQGTETGTGMPAASSPAAALPTTGPAGAATMKSVPTSVATTKAAPTVMPTSGPAKATKAPTGMATAKATIKPTTPAMKATAAPTGKATTGGVRTGERAERGERGVGGGFVINVIDRGIITTTISPGGIIRGYVVIQNNGNDVINDAIVHIVVTQANAAGVTVTTQDQPLSNLNVAPGDQKRVEFAVGVPPSIAPGSYDVRATVEANGQQLQSFTNTVTVS